MDRAVFIASTAIVFLSLLAWPLAALWRYLRKRRWSEDSGERRNFLAVRLVMLVDVAVIGAVAVLFAKSSDYTIFNDALDPWLLALYALAWLGVFGALADAAGHGRILARVAPAADGRGSTTR